MRELKFHEKKLLRKTSLYSWSSDDNLRVSKILRRYHIQNRQDYDAYMKIVGHCTSLSAKLKTLNGADKFRIDMTMQLLNKLDSLAVIDSGSSLAKVDGLTVSAFCRRRLPVLLVRLKLAESVKQAVTLVEQGQIRVGPNVVTDPSFLVSRRMEDFVTWSDGSKIKRKVEKYNGRLDDFDLLEG